MWRLVLSCTMLCYIAVPRTRRAGLLLLPISVLLFWLYFWYNLDCKVIIKHYILTYRLVSVSANCIFVIMAEQNF